MLSIRLTLSGVLAYAGMLVALDAGTLAAQGAPAPINYAAGDVIPSYDSLRVPSRALGEERRINVHLPKAYASSPATRFPVLYMPDGGTDEDFPHVVNTVDSLVALKLIRPVIVVGIPNTERRRDLTGPTRVGTDSAIAKRVGGSAAFRAFIRDELLPVIGTRYRTTGERSIIGESLAGLFVVETMVLDPTLFTHYIALDPSLWWNKQGLTADAPSHVKKFDAASRSLYFASSSDDVDATNAAFATMLRKQAPATLAWTYTPRNDLQHSTIFRGDGPTALLKALK